MRLKSIASAITVGGALLSIFSAASNAGTTSFCISCVDPDRTYVCNVDTPDGNASPGALQFYCIVRTAKEEGHKSCAVSRQVGASCVGIEKTYVYEGPTLPLATQAAVDEPVPLAPADPVTEPPKREQPKTVVEMTSNAAHRTGNAMRNTAETAERAGSRMGNAVQNVRSAARSALHCMRSLFRDCGSSEQ